MLVRLLTSIIALPVLAVFLVIGGLPLKIFIFALIAAGMYEIYNALSKKRLSVHYVGFVFSAVYILLIDYLDNPNIMTIILMTFTLCALTLLVIFHQKINIVSCMETLFGFFYVAVLLSAVYLVRMGDQGAFLVWFIFIAAWGSDTGAYIVGKTLKLGKRKLIPSLSPKKTVEGAVGGVVAAVVLAALYGFILVEMNYIDNSGFVFVSAVFGFFGSIFSMVGDLTASAIKRYTGIKDYGTILPGHGGVIDRFDSVLFTAPAVFLVTLAIMG